MFKLEHVKYKSILDIQGAHIKPGIITAVLGESGSGKTTLLKLLNKLISCDKGTIYYNKTPIEEIEPVKLRREVVMLPQEPAVFDGDIRENLIIGLKFSKKEIPPDQTLSEMLDKIRLNKKLDDKTQTLSGGEKQRLVLGRIMLMHPEVLLLDEPSASLDEDTERAVISELSDYAKSYNKTLVMVTHSKKMAHEFADEIIKIRAGKIEDGGK